MTVGRLLQVLGTDCFRVHVGPDVWVDAVFRRQNCREHPLILADTRFPNESAAVRKNGGVVILVTREGAGRADGRSARHISETALDGEEPDVTIANNGTVGDLARALDRAWPEIVRIARGRARE